MVEERWIIHDTFEEPSSTTHQNGIKSLPLSSLKIPKIVRPGPSADAQTPSREQDMTDREQLRGQLTSLQALLEKTSKKGGDLIRNWRGRDVNQCPQFAENMKLQHDVEKRIEEVKGKLFEISRRLGSNKEEKEEEKKPETIDVSIPKPFTCVPIQEDDEDITFKVFNDPGVHWCKNCDIFSSDITAHLKHLQSEKHWKACETKEEPWRKNTNKPKLEIDPQKKIPVEIKGTHMLMPIRGYFCQICGVLLGSPSHAEDHLKTNKHNRCYNRHVLMNGTMELNYSVSKSRALAKMQKLESKRQREQEEKEEREKEAKRRATEAEIKKRMSEEKDKENRAKKNRESLERGFSDAKTSSEFSRSKDDEKERKINRENDRNREKDRDKDRERDRDKEKDRDREKSVKNSMHKLKIKDKERSKDKEREREKEKESYKLKKRHDDAKRPEKTHKSSTIIEPVDDSVYGPHFPFRDRKLAMKTIVYIPKNEWQLCYKKHLKLMMSGKLPTMSKKTEETRQKQLQEQLQVQQESVPNSISNEAQKPSSPPPPADSDMDNVDSSIGDLVLAITSDRGLSDNEFEKDQDINLNSAANINDMFTIEYDDEEEKMNKVKESDFVVSTESDFARYESLSIATEVEDVSLPNPLADAQMLSPPIWTQPLSLHDLAD